MNTSLSAALVLGLLTSFIMASPLNFVIEKDQPEKCKPGDNCKLPHCRCWDDPHFPGKLKKDDIPMMILLTFDYSFNENTISKYLELFATLKNPNGCPATGTFFAQKYNSDAKTVKMLADKHFELGVNSDRGVIPVDESTWLKNIQAVKTFLKNAGVDTSKVKGLRAPQLFSGGDGMLEALTKEQLSYDASCVTVEHSAANKLLWPFTLDYVKDIPACSQGRKISKAFPGKWEFLLPTLQFNGAICPTPSGCIPAVNTTSDVFQLFSSAFSNHYNTKAPFIIDIDARWVTDNDRIMGTKQFLELIAAYPDTWIVTMSQALEWIKDPQTSGASLEFGPWKCPKGH